MIVLREYQATALEGIREAYRQKKRAPLLVAPTGSGKSAMLGYMLANTKRRSLILAHRRELVEQISASLPVDHGIIAAGRTSNDLPIQVGMMQTVVRRLDRLPQFEWVISDEAHLSASPTWLRVLKHYGSALHLGLSATPTRLDGKSLGDHFDAIVQGPTIKELVALGHLSPCRVFAPPVDFGKLRTVRGDYDMAEAERALDRASITGDAVDHLKRICPERKTLVFCCGIKHAAHVAEQFRDAGFSATSVDGEMSDRNERVRDFRSGKIQVLVNVDLLTTGFDCPSISAGILLRPTQSLALYLQMIGRLLRVFPGKSDAVLLDHVGAVLRHGLPNADRDWSLDSAETKARKATQATIATRRCKVCFAVFEPHHIACPHCGAVAATESRRIEQRAGELVEITEEMERTERLASAPYFDTLKELKTPEQVKAMAKARGYRPAWSIRTVMDKFDVSDRTAAKMLGYDPAVVRHLRIGRAA